MIHRTITKYLTYAAAKFPVVALTGPRQSGKTTLVQTLFSYKPYSSLEDPDVRDFAKEDPRGYLSQFQDGAVIDEAQNVPQLFSYIQTRVDQSKKSGEFILTGSQNFSLLESISQSLAGRCAVTHLLPLSVEELVSSHYAPEDPFQLIQKGFYPRIYDQDIPATDWYKSYINTYIERDVRKITNISDLSKFQLFLKLCAGRIGQLLNMSSLATECGVNHTTIKSWISILEASFIVFLLRPHHKSFNKRLVKQPKLYFYDTGVAAYLLGIYRSQDMMSHHMRGALFENFVVADLIKQSYSKGREHNLHFWRDNHGHEIDVVMDLGERLISLEIKSSQTIVSEHFKALNYWRQLTNAQNGYLVYAGSQSYLRNSVNVVGWKDLHTAVADIE